MENKFYVYMLLDPRKLYLPFYVGKGQRSRAYDHFRKGHNNNRLKQAVIDKIIAAKLKPVVLMWAIELLEEDAFAIEKLLIQKFGRRVDNSGILTNMTLGGEGLCGHHFTEEHRAKIGAAHKGRICSKETIERMRKSKLGVKLSDEHRAKISENNLKSGKWQGENNFCFGKTGELHHNYGKSFTIGDKNGMYSKKHSEESIAIMKEKSAARKGKGIYGSKDIYEFTHKNGEVFIGTPSQFSEKFSIKSERISALKCGRSKTCFGWTLQLYKTT